MWLLCFAVLAAAAEDPDGPIKRTKIRACVEATRYKMKQEQAFIGGILATTIFDPKKINDKIAAEILLNCFRNIELRDAAKMVASPNFEVTEEINRILTYETKTFDTERQLFLTKEQKELIAEIEKDFETSSPRSPKDGELKAKPRETFSKLPTVETFTFGSWFVPAFFIGFICLVGLAARSLLKASQKDDKKSKKPKKQ